MTTEARRRATAATLLAGMVLVSACGNAEAGRSDRPAGNAIRFGDDGGKLKALEPAIRELLTATLAKVQPALELTGVTIVVSSDASGTIPGYGVGGFTPNGTTVQIYIDPAYPEIARLLREHLPPLAAHELHHARRWQGPGYGKTLLEALVSEGLADHFAIELLGVPVPPWSDALPRTETAHYLELAQTEFDSVKYGHPRWFFGAGPGLPRWTGYTLGFRLVETYQAAHGGASAAQLVNTRASAFRPD